MPHNSNILYPEDTLLNNRSNGYFPKTMNSGNKAFMES